AGHEDRKLDDGTDSEEEEDARVQVEDDHVAADGENRVGHEGSDYDEDRREEVDDVIGRERDDVFLGEGLDAVGDGLKEAGGAGAIRAVAVLDTAEAFALEDGGDGEEEREGDEDGDDGEDCGGQWLSDCGEVAE